MLCKSSCGVASSVGRCLTARKLTKPDEPGEPNEEIETVTVLSEKVVWPWGKKEW